MNTKIETLIAKYERQITQCESMLPFANPDTPVTLRDKELIEDWKIILAALRQADQQTQPAAQKTHSVEDSPEYKLGFAAGRESYARHYKCGCTAFPADAPAYCPIHDGTTKQEQQNGL